MQEPMAFVTTIAAVAASVGVEVVVPVADVATMLISAHRDQLPAGCRVPFGDIDVVSRAADKARLIETARRIGVPVPESVTIGSVHEVPDDVTFPIVVKPWRSRIQTTAGWLATSVSYAADRGELLADLRQRAPEEFPVMLQERIEGPGIGVFACCRDGVPTAMFSHRRIRERPPWGGVSVLSESVALPSPAHEYATALLGAIGWQGVAMVEFKEDRRDRQPKLMEINGRFWGSLQLAIDAGVDFPVLALQTLERGTQAPPPTYAIGVRSRWLWGDFDALLLTLRGRRTVPGYVPMPRWRALAGFLGVWRPGLHYDNPQWDDPWPFARESADRLRHLMSAVKSRSSAA